jgi:hypothetical protein
LLANNKQFAAHLISMASMVAMGVLMITCMTPASFLEMVGLTGDAKIIRTPAVA